MGDREGAMQRPTLVVVSSEQLWSSLTSLLQESLAGGDGAGDQVSLSSVGSCPLCDITLGGHGSLRLLSPALKPHMSREDAGQALANCVRSGSPPDDDDGDGAGVLFLLLLQGGRYTSREEETTGLLQERFSAEVFKFLVVVSLERRRNSGAVEVLNVLLDDGLLDLIRLCDGRFCRVAAGSPAPAARAQLVTLLKMAERAMEESGGSGYNREMLGEAGRRNVEDTAMGLLLEKLLRADEQQEAFRAKVGRREEERARELEELKSRQAEERRSEAEEERCYQAKKESLEEAVRSHATMVQLEKNAAPDDETRKTSVVLVGLSGSGKTATMNMILKRAGQRYSPGRDPGQQEVPQPTASCLRREVLHKGTKLVLVDTPELLDEDGAENLDVVKDSLALALPGPHAFLLVFQSGRFTQGESDLLAQLPKIFGPQFAERTVVVFTRDDATRGGGASPPRAPSVERYVADAPTQLQEMVRRCGSRYHALDVGDVQGALSYPQVRELLSGVRRLVASHGGQPLVSKRFSSEDLRDRRDKIQARLSRRSNASGQLHYSSFTISE